MKNKKAKKLQEKKNITYSLDISNIYVDFLGGYIFQQEDIE